MVSANETFNKILIVAKEEGFKLKTREKMEQDLGDHVLELSEGPEPTNEIMTGEAKIINKDHKLTLR